MGRTSDKFYWKQIIFKTSICLRCRGPAVEVREYVTVPTNSTGTVTSDLGTHSFFPGALSAHFYPWIAIAHFADFQVRSSLNC